MKSFFCLLVFVFISLNMIAQKTFPLCATQLLLPLPKAIDSCKISFSGLKAIPQNYYTQHLGFFCKKEMKLEQVTHIPIRIRLGSVEYCDKLEGKTK